MILLIDTQRDSSPLDKAVAGFIRNLYGNNSFASFSAQGPKLHLGLIKPPSSNRRSQVSASLDLCLTIPACYSSSCRAECDRDGLSCQLTADDAARVISALRIVYSLRSSNPRATTKTFVYHCPQCNAASTVLPSLQAALQHAQQHTAGACNQNSGQAVGTTASDMQPPSNSMGALVSEEEVEVQLLARVLALAALHIANLTQQNKDKRVPLAAAAPPPAAAAAGPGMPATAQLKPWRGWAISCLSENEELLASVTAWIRPTWHSIHLHSSSSNGGGGSSSSSTNGGVAGVLDAILAPPYVAVLDQAVGTVLEKLAVLLKRHKCDRALQAAAAAAQQQQQQHDAADANGDSALALLSDVLSHDPGFAGVQQLPTGEQDAAAAAEHRVSALLSQAGISSIDMVQAAMADYPWVTDTHVQVCAFCGLSTGGLRSFKKFSTYLRPCSYCVVCVCAACIAGNNGLDVDAIAEKEGPAAAAAAAVKAAAATPWPGNLCPWCQDHQDAQGYLSSVSPTDWHYGPATPSLLTAAAAGRPLTLAQQQLLRTWQGEEAWRLLPLPTVQLPPGYIQLQLQLQSGGSRSRAGGPVLLLGDTDASLFVAPDGTVVHYAQQAWEDADKTALKQEKKHAAREKANRQQQQQQQYQRQYDGYPQQQRRRRGLATEGGTPPDGLAVQQAVAEGAVQAAGASWAERTAGTGAGSTTAANAAASVWEVEGDGDAGLAPQLDNLQQQQQRQLVDTAPAVTVQRHRAHKRSTVPPKDADQQVDRQLGLLTASALQQQQQQQQMPEEEHSRHLQELHKLQCELQQLQQGIFGATTAAAAAGGGGGQQQQQQDPGDVAVDSTRVAAAAAAMVGGAKSEQGVVWLVDASPNDEQHPAMQDEKALVEVHTSQLHNTQQQQQQQQQQPKEEKDPEVVLAARKRGRGAQQQPNSSAGLQQPADRPGSGKSRKVVSAAADGGDTQQQQQQQAAASSGEDASAAAAAAATAATAVGAAEGVLRGKVDAANKSLAKLLRQLQGPQQHAAAACAAVQQLLASIERRQQWLVSSCQHSSESTLLGLQVLQQVIEALSYLPSGSASRGGLAQCLLQPIAREFGSKNSTPPKLSVLDLLLLCWRTEVQHTGCAFEDAPRAAGMPVEALAGSSSSSSAERQVQVLLAGMSQLAYAIMVECYCPADTCVQGGGADVVAMHQVKLQVAVTLMQGTALLLIHWPKAAVASRVQHATQWRQQLADLAGACHIAKRLSSMLSQLKQQVDSMKGVCGW